MLNIKSLIAASALTLAAVMPAQAEFVLDSFDEYNINDIFAFTGTDELFVSAISSPALFDTELSSGVDVSYELVYPALGDSSSNATANTTDTFGVNDGELQYTSAGDTASTLNITYTDSDFDAFGGALGDGSAGYDFTLLGSALSLDITSVDLSFNLSVIVSYIDTVSASIMTDTMTFLVDSVGELNIAFDSFANADFTKVTAIAASITGLPNADFTLGSISVVPEPSALALLGLGLLGLGLRRRKLV